MLVNRCWTEVSQPNTTVRKHCIHDVRIEHFDFV